MKMTLKEDVGNGRTREYHVSYYTDKAPCIGEHVKSGSNMYVVKDVITVLENFNVRCEVIMERCKEL